MLTLPTLPVQPGPLEEPSQGHDADAATLRLSVDDSLTASCDSDSLAAAPASASVLAGDDTNDTRVVHGHLTHGDLTHIAGGFLHTDVNGSLASPVFASL